MTDPLSSLIISPDTIVRQKLASILQNRVRLDPEHDAVHLLTSDGVVKARVLLALMGRHALALVKAGVNQGLQPREITDITGIAPGSVRPALLRLSTDRLVAQNEVGAYVIPVAMLDKAIAIVTGPPAEEAA